MFIGKFNREAMSARLSILTMFVVISSLTGCQTIQTAGLDGWADSAPLLAEIATTGATIAHASRNDSSNSATAPAPVVASARNQSGTNQRQSSRFTPSEPLVVAPVISKTRSPDDSHVAIDIPIDWSTVVATTNDAGESARDQLPLATNDEQPADSLMPRIWVQDANTSVDVTSLQSFSIGATPMFANSLRIDAAEELAVVPPTEGEQPIRFEPVDPALVLNTDTQAPNDHDITEDNDDAVNSDGLRLARSTDNFVQPSIESAEEINSTFINVQAGECADVVGGGLLNDAFEQRVGQPQECLDCVSDAPINLDCSPIAVATSTTGIRPPDEYICDGGDAGVHVRVNEDWSLRGLETEDTIGHYDTLDGRTEVSPSNSVCIYAPRFANVRKVIGTFADENVIEPGRLLQPEVVGQDRGLETHLHLNQRTSPSRDVHIGTTLVFRDRTRGTELRKRQRVRELTNVQELHVNLHVLEFGIFKRSEKARLAEFIDAATAWTDAVGPEVLINDTKASIDVITQRPAIAYHMDDSGDPRLRIVKIASTKDALPGDEVEFTLRFDNVGDQTIGNVTIIDNLTARLEYLPDTAKCSIDADFYTEENEAGSLVLRWEIIEPLAIGEGGLITFKCKVR